MKSIRHELSFRLLTGACVLLVLAGGLLGLAVHARLLEEFDRTLGTKARALASLTALEGQYLEVEFSGEHMPEFVADGEPEYFDLRLPTGTLIMNSPSLGDQELPFAAPASDEPVFQNLRLPDGRDGRIMHLKIRPRVEREEDDEADDDDDEADEYSFAIPDLADGNPLLVIAVARSREDLNALFLSISGTLVALDILLLLGIALLVRASVRRGLQPIAAINEQISAIGPDGLERRVSLSAPPEELRAIIGAINDLVERLQDAFKRERQFSGDVAHELRTPVTELRTACEVGARWPDNRETTRQFFRDAQDIAVQMEKIVANLLILARCDAGSEVAGSEPVSLEPLLRQRWESSSLSAANRGLRATFEIGPDAAVITDAGKLEIIVQNLIENAVSYSVPRSVIRCFTATTDSGLELVIENDVGELTKEDLKHLFDRFWRKDPARTGGAHAGLGLSIARALCDLLRIGLHMDLKENVFSARLSFASVPTQPASVV